MIGIIDYGMGNLRSVQKAFEKLGFAAEFVTTAQQIFECQKLVLPGVGAFRDAMGELNRLGLADPIRAYAAHNRPFLGICLGMQLLFDVSYEDGEWPGLGILPGKVVRFERPAGWKVPHMGWNQLEFSDSETMFAGVPQESSVYFVHSYHVVPAADTVIAAQTDYGGRFVSVVRRGNLFATQFHPEKSQKTGLQLLTNFAEKA